MVAANCNEREGGRYGAGMWAGGNAYGLIAALVLPRLSKTFDLFALQFAHCACACVRLCVRVCVCVRAFNKTNADAAASGTWYLGRCNMVRGTWNVACWSSDRNNGRV